jgi:Cu/Zn superoxide dismutase
MKTFFALVALAATAQATQLRGLTDNGKIKLKAKFDLDGLNAKIVAVQTDEDREKSQATWKVTVKSFDSSLCPSEEFNWHIHQLPLDLGEGAAIRNSDSGSAAACGKFVTGGHYDPTFACGGASHNGVVNSGVTGFYSENICDTIDTATGEARTYSCTNDEPYLCEFGDQSGKLGRIDASNTETVKYKDRYMDNLANVKGRSLVLHCCTESGCGDRLACAQLEEVV